ncbi:MAG: hypothetical protein O2782_20040 [bacterium]|nr:hypothetical protein [bacterium]
MTPRTTISTRNALTLQDRLSRLTYLRACKLLGEEGKRLIQLGGTYEIDIDEQVTMDGDVFRVRLPECVATIALAAHATQHSAAIAPRAAPRVSMWGRRCL